MARHRDVVRERAVLYAQQAASLQRGAELLLSSNYPHPAHLLACHAAINAADAIVVLETGDTHTGDHRRSAEALLEADASLTELSQALGRLSEEKNTMAYRPAERDVPRHEAAIRESRELVEEACHRLGLAAPQPVLAGDLTTVAELGVAVRDVLTERRLDPQADPWETVLVVLELLSQLLGDTTLDELASQVRNRSTS